MKHIYILLYFLIPIAVYAQEPMKIFGEIKKGHPIYEVSKAICAEMEKSGRFPNMSAVYAKLKQPGWEKQMPKSYGAKINTELLCDCDVYLDNIIKYKEPAYHEKWPDNKRRMYELAHLAASTILTYRNNQLLPRGLNNLQNQIAKINLESTGVRLSSHRDDLLYHIQSHYHEKKKAYKITYYRFFPFSEEYYLANDKNIAFEIILNFKENGDIDEIYGVKDGPQYVFIKGHDRLEEEEEEEDLPQFEETGEEIELKSEKPIIIKSEYEVEEHHEIFKSVDGYHITTNGKYMGLKSDKGKFYLNHFYQDIKHIEGTRQFKIVNEQNKQGVYDAELEKFILVPENGYVQLIEYNDLTYYLVTNNRLRNWFDISGKQIFPQDSRMIKEFNDGILTQDGKTVNFYNSSFELVHQASYFNATIRTSPANRIIVYDGEYSLVLGENFEVIVPSGKYNFIRQIGNSLYQTSNRLENNEMNYGLIDYNGQEVYECVYPNSITEISRNGETFFKVPVTKTTYTYHLNGKRLFADAYTSIYEIAGGNKSEHFIVTKNKKQGIINRNDVLIHQCIYNEINQSYAYVEEFKDLFTIEEKKQMFAVARKGEDWYSLKKNGDAEKIKFK